MVLSLKGAGNVSATYPQAQATEISSKLTGKRFHHLKTIGGDETGAGVDVVARQNAVTVIVRQNHNRQIGLQERLLVDAPLDHTIADPGDDVLAQINTQTIGKTAAPLGHNRVRDHVVHTQKARDTVPRRALTGGKALSHSGWPTYISAPTSAACAAETPIRAVAATAATAVTATVLKNAFIMTSQVVMGRVAFAHLGSTVATSRIYCNRLQNAIYYLLTNGQ
jgi:hypothetical protein